MGRLEATICRNDQDLMLLYVPSREATWGRSRGWLGRRERIVGRSHRMVSGEVVGAIVGTIAQMKDE
ncbi:hypothetical protein QJS10_CPB14g01271 [Acorus calamus]|uniref:Uncharacterized protein n=1 Tax=Acorus calamus TaxID=4465 RepID=A0AAV9DAD7_ACOCL|nr:hypothetical protein QJS10_CPB14g01271 [Acorus calamus]